MKNSIMTDKELCANAALERPRYFARQMLTQAELTLEQNYFRDRLRRHNRLLHGWGVVCGANVCAIPKEDKSGPEAWKIRVMPGYILGPYGDEIVIDCERVVDLRTSGVTGMTGESPADQVDPWCSEVFVDRREGPFYIAVKFKEVMTRPVRVQPVGCGCDDNQCEYSRWRDGYEIGILSECPDSHLKVAGKEQYMRTQATSQEAEVVAYQSATPPQPTITPPPIELRVERQIYFTDGCPPCPPDPWVVLGLVQIDSNGAIKSIDNCVCRRIAPTLALLARACHRKPLAIKTVTPDTLEDRATDININVDGEGFEPGAEVSLGSDVTVKQVEVKAEGAQLTFTANVSANAAAGPRTLTITNPDCSTAAKEVTVGQAAVVQPPPTRPVDTTSPRGDVGPVAQPPTGLTPRRNLTERTASKKGRRREE